MSDQACASTGLATGISPDDSHHLAVEFEIHLGVWQKTSPLADVGRYGYLSFRCDSHWWSLLLRVGIGDVFDAMQGWHGRRRANFAPVGARPLWGRSCPRGFWFVRSAADSPNSDLVLKGADDALQSNWGPRNSAADIIEGRFCDFCHCQNAQATTFSWGWLDVPISLLYEVFALLRYDTREDLSYRPFYQRGIVSEPEFFAARKLS